MNGGDLYEIKKILGHANIKMTDCYAKLGRGHIARIGNTARELWKLLDQEKGNKGGNMKPEGSNTTREMFPLCSRG